MPQTLKTQKSGKHMHRTQLYLPAELHHSLTIEAKSLTISNSELIRQIISQYLNRNYRQNTEDGLKLLLDMGEDA